MDDYIEQAHVTAAGERVYVEKVDFGLFQHLMREFILAATALDHIKKSLFYGRDLPQGLPTSPDLSRQSWEEFLPGIHSDPAKAMNILHAIIGKATETGELCEALDGCGVSLKHFDPVNALEECGDGLWYDALLLRAIGADFPEAQRVNIAKLRRRFGDRFSEYDANNRDLGAEREILERGAPAVDDHAGTGDRLSWPEVNVISRMPDNDCAILLGFARPLTGDEMRGVVVTLNMLKGE